MSEYLSLIGSIVRIILSVSSSPQIYQNKTERLENSNSSATSFNKQNISGLLCSIDPLGTHVMILQLKHLEDKTLNRSIIMLHKEMIDTLELVADVPDIWKDYLTDQIKKSTKKVEEKKQGSNQSVSPAEREQADSNCLSTLNFLKSHGVVATVVEKSIDRNGHQTCFKKIVAFGGALTINGPKYDSAGCNSVNSLILRRVRTLLEKGNKK
jgi:hypothetical protein